MVIEIDKKKCVKCAGCVSVCPKDALILHNELLCDDKKCIDCQICVRFCPMGALKVKK